LKTEGRYISPGHAGILNDNGTNWFTYHYYDRDESGTPKLALTKLYWTPDHWPTLTNGLAKPSP
jgi:arabinan endo-1,5-alpha-L-arabinosidase